MAKYKDAIGTYTPLYPELTGLPLPNGTVTTTRHALYLGYIIRQCDLEKVEYCTAPNDDVMSKTSLTSRAVKTCRQELLAAGYLYKMATSKTANTYKLGIDYDEIMAQKAKKTPVQKRTSSASKNVHRIEKSDFQTCGSVGAVLDQGINKTVVQLEQKKAQKTGVPKNDINRTTYPQNASLNSRTICEDKNVPTDQENLVELVPSGSVSATPFADPLNSSLGLVDVRSSSADSASRREYAILSHLKQTRGTRSPNVPQERSALHSLLNAGWSEQDVLALLAWADQDEFWGSRNLAQKLSASCASAYEEFRRRDRLAHPDQDEAAIIAKHQQEMQDQFWAMEKDELLRSINDEPDPSVVERGTMD